MFIHNYQIIPGALDREGCTIEQKKWEDVRSDIEGNTTTLY